MTGSDWLSLADRHNGEMVRNRSFQPHLGSETTGGGGSTKGRGGCGCRRRRTKCWGSTGSRPKRRRGWWCRRRGAEGGRCSRLTQAKGGCGGGGIRGGRTWSRGEDVGGVTSSMRARTRRRATHTHAFTLAKRLPKAGAAGVAPNAEVPVAPNAGAVAAGVPKPGLAPKALVGLMPTVGLTAPKAPERCRSGQRSGGAVG